ncbi:MAG: 30S ribosomal protein S6 [Hyphomicrobiaceae bacterium]|nr:30S ribosomal protein S6 [Hyphomicrobiaceae bacterium]
MSLYEHTFMARHDISAQQMEALTEKFSAVLKENGGKVVNSEYWGLKNLAYRIKKNRKAHYGYMQLETPHAAVAEMERQMTLTTDILRFMTIRVDKHEEGPSAMMRKSDRDDRKPRGGGRFGGGGRGGPRDDRRPPRSNSSGDKRD